MMNVEGDKRFSLFFCVSYVMFTFPGVFVAASGFIKILLAFVVASNCLVLLACFLVQCHVGILTSCEQH